MKRPRRPVVIGLAGLLLADGLIGPDGSGKSTVEQLLVSPLTPFQIMLPIGLRVLWDSVLAMALIGAGLFSFSPVEVQETVQVRFRKTPRSQI